MKNKKTLSICILILMTFFTIISFKNVFNNINYGLDLKGGFEVLYKVESGYDMYWSEELEDNYDVYELSKLINKVDLPSKECLMDFLL